MAAVTDPIADLLNRIRNGQKARFDKVDIPASRMKTSIARILKEEGYIKNFKLIRDNKQGILRVHLKYDENREGSIAGVKRVSKPGCRDYEWHGSCYTVHFQGSDDRSPGPQRGCRRRIALLRLVGKACKIGRIHRESITTAEWVLDTQE
jgi:ribosomal protein S8